MAPICYKCELGISHIFHDNGTRTDEATPKHYKHPGYPEIKDEGEDDDDA